MIAKSKWILCPVCKNETRSLRVGEILLRNVKYASTAGGWILFHFLR